VEESRRRRRRRRSFSDEISRRGAADEEEEGAEGLGLCFCFEAGCFFLGAIWPRASYRLIVSGDGVAWAMEFLNSGTPDGG
jgi:hypothetical protein